MSGGYLLDTHHWFWVQEGRAEDAGEAFLAEANSWARSMELYVSALSVLEIAQLSARGRIRLGRTVDEWVDQGVSAGGAQLLPLSNRILILSTQLPWEVHRDPADRMLLATALVHGLTLVTRDRLLVEYGRQGFVRVMER